MIRPNLLIVMIFSLILVVPALGQAKVGLYYPEFKLDPVQGRLVGWSSNYPINDLAPFNLLNQQQTAHISVFLGETALLQLAIPPAASITIHSGKQSGLAIKYYRIGAVSTASHTGDYFPDILIPFLPAGERQVQCDASPKQAFPDQRKIDLILLELTTQVDAVPGDYLFGLNVQADERTYTMGLEVTIHNQALLSSKIKIDFNEYGAKYLRPFIKEKEIFAINKIEWNVFRLCRENGGELNPLPYKSQKGTPRNGMAPRVLSSDPLHPRLDWREYDARFGPLFDGSAFEDNQPIDHFYLPFNPNWPAPFALYQADRQRYEAIWKAFAREFLKHFQEKGWTQTIFQVYCNQKPTKKNRIPWHLDEPQSVADYQALRYYADLTHASFPKNHPVKVRFRLDISHFYCDKHRGHSGKDFRVNGGGDTLEPVDIWVISAHSLRGKVALRKARELLKRGKEVWMYSETPTIEESGQANMEHLYFVWKNRLSGFLVWKSFAFRINGEKSSDFIFYALNLEDHPQIYSSLRVKLLKRSIDDIGRLSMAGQRGSQWLDAYVAALHQQDIENLFQLRQSLSENLFWN